MGSWLIRLSGSRCSRHALPSKESRSFSVLIFCEIRDAGEACSIFFKPVNPELRIF